MTTRQLALSFPALARDPAVTYVETSCQAEAREALSRWRDWPGGALALVGPPGSGKSHLAALWARASGACPWDRAEQSDIGARLIEDADRAADDTALLAAFEAARSGRAPAVLFTARVAPALWPVGIPDLASRVALAAAVHIGDPSDEDLAAVFAKHLADRGADASDALLDYAVRRMERSFAAAEALADALDRAALERKQKVTRKLAQDVLESARIKHGEDAE